MRAARRVSIFLASVVVAACAGLSGADAADRSMTGGEPVATDLPGLQGVGLHQVWQRQVRLEPGEQVKKTWRLGASVYVATTESRIIRVEAKTGILKWSVGLGAENFEIYQTDRTEGTRTGLPTGQVLVVTRGEAFIFNMETGDEVAAGTPGDKRFGRSRGDRQHIVRGRGRHVLWSVPGPAGDETVGDSGPGDLFFRPRWPWTTTCWWGARAGNCGASRADTGDWDWKDRKTNGDDHRGPGRGLQRGVRAVRKPAGVRVPHGHGRGTMGAAVGQPAGGDAGAGAGR